MANDIRKAMEALTEFDRHLKDIFFDEYPEQLARENPDEYNRLLDEFLNNYDYRKTYAVHD